MVSITPSSPIEVLRQQRHARWLEDLVGKLRGLVASQPLSADQQLHILLFGSRARGDWDGYSDTDLLVVAPQQEEADLWADRLLDAGLAEDVVPLDQRRWQGMATSASPHWRAVKAQAISLLSLPQ